MGACAWLVLVIVNEVAALLYAQQSSPCEVVSNAMMIFKNIYILQT